MTYIEAYDQLVTDGWREYPNQFKKYARCFYKQFDTPTRCAGNDEKPGVQVEIDVSEHEGVVSFELELCAGLGDGTWLTIKNYSLPHSFDGVVSLIPRMLALWEFANK